jgi:hypothetical protein
MKTSKLITAAVLATLAVGYSTVARASSPYPYSGNNDQKGEKLIFVTGSLIPQRVKIKPIGTATTSPMRTYDRNEIDSLGRFTTRDILATDPALRVSGSVGGGFSH